ncbi:MAG: hypothetical protein IJG13_21255 [Kiritimatiellae bacterium]|nr:hypothetical protein [Kiritimatiellia bacterium]MBQ3341319.1 hypothetical protein [Kiritimatiellia bacterium]
MKTEMGRLAAVCAVVICATALGATSDVNLKDRALGGNDFSYYRWSGAGETFVMTTAAVTTNLERRAKFWKRVEFATVPTIFQLTFPKTAPDWKQKLPKTAEEAVAAIDAFFAPGEGLEPCPKKIYAVTPCEENVTWEGQTEVQNAIARHLRAKYGVKTYQWLTEPMKPTLAIQADGWVFDAYCITDPGSFYAHLESFVLTGVPVVPCIWASGHFCKYHTNRTWDDLTRFTVERMDMCRALDLPVMVFSVAGKSGSVGAWFGKTDDPGERYYRETIKHYLSAVPTMPKASWRPVQKTWRANVKRDGTVRSKVDLKSFGLVDETTFDDVRAWRLADTGLNLVAGRGRLSWQMRPQGRVRKGRFSLRHSPNAKGTFCGRPLSPRGLTEMDVGEFDCKTLVLDATAPITLTELSFFGEGDCSVEVVGVEMDTSYGRTDYRRQFAFDSEEAAQAGEKGHVARKRVVRKVLLPGCGGKLMVEAKAFAHKSYAGSVKMWLSLDGETPLAEVATAGDNKVWHDLSIEHKIADGVDAVYLVFDVVVSCGVNTGATAGAKVTTCDFKFRPEHP